MVDENSMKRPRSFDKKLSDKERDKTRVNVGLAFPRWRAQREAKGLQFDSALALLLLDHYQKGPLASTPLKATRLAGLPPALSDIGEGSASDRSDMGEMDLEEDQVSSLENCVIEVSSLSEEGSGEDSSDEDYVPSPRILLEAAIESRPKIDKLPVISADETVHDFPENIGTSTEPEEGEQLSSGQLRVLFADDIIDCCAAIVYDKNLLQLIRLVAPPVQWCPHTLSKVKMCQSLPPFECVIKQK
ncbi:uncharacterized protein LOC119503727 [Scomber scombrus]|uniref:Uncharacterized protein LOC119503727 n=1 Tax=Scomber scombrus TaxID=13677 RepID=A0AAV1Q9L9_SCOSC